MEIRLKTAFWKGGEEREGHAWAEMHFYEVIQQLSTGTERH